jgi:hypothetical protein
MAPKGESRRFVFRTAAGKSIGWSMLKVTVLRCWHRAIRHRSQHASPCHTAANRAVAGNAGLQCINAAPPGATRSSRTTDECVVASFLLSGLLPNQDT